MRWRGRRTSTNIDDRRGGGFRGLGGGRGRRVAMGGGGIGLGGAVILLVLALVFGVDPAMLLGGGGGGFTMPQGTGQQATGPNQIDDEAEQFVAVVLADTEEVWSEMLAGEGGYAEPTLVLYSGGTASACGTANAAAGPFYCPGDRRIYLDTDFFRVLDQRMGAGGDFAFAYVIAHEVAHHVQNLLGILPEVNNARMQAGEAESNRLSVMVELQADCFSGVWARRAEERFGTLEEGDIDEALNAASQIGDDTLQRNAGRAVVPDSFQHGSSQQRMHWFHRGYDGGDPNACDTFNAAEL